MPSTFASALAFCLLLSYLPFALSTTTPKALTFTSKFDDFPKTSLGAIAPLPKPIYDELLFGGWSYKTNFLVGNIPESKPNYPTFAVLAKKICTTPPVTNITTKYVGSNVKSYALNSLYVACMVAITGNVPPVAGQPPPIVTSPEPCTIKFSGTTAAGQAVDQECQYSGTPADSVAQLCVFDQTKFGNVTTVTVEVVSALSTTLLAAGDIDTVNHTNYY